MLIGDKGQSGGRRWGGGLFGGFRYSDQSQGQTLGGGRICPWAIFDQSSGQSLGRCPDSPIWDFRTVSRSDAGIPSFCLKGILRAVLGSDAWRWSDSPIRDFRPSLGSDAWQVVSFPDSGLFTSPLVSRWGYAFSGIRSLHKVITWSLIRNSPCSTNGYSHLIILTSYLS